MCPLGDRRTQEEQSAWFRPLLHINHLWRSLYIFGLWFPQLKNDHFSSPIAFCLQPSLSCWRHTVKNHRLYAGKAGNTEPGPEQGVLTFKIVIIFGHWGKWPSKSLPLDPAQSASLTKPCLTHPARQPAEPRWTPFPVCLPVSPSLSLLLPSVIS